MRCTSKLGERLWGDLSSFRSLMHGRAKAYLQVEFQAARNRAQIRRRLARAWIRSRVRRIQTKDAIRLVAARNLNTVNGSWHFSWDIERFFDSLFLYESDDYTYVFRTEPLNEWAPAPLFTDDPRVDFLIAATGKNCPFWLLKLTTFDDFLARRSELSRQPTKNFPTQQTYPRYARKIACKLERLPLHGNIEFFCKYYNQWKLGKWGHTGEYVMDQFFSGHDNVPKEWLFIHSLRDTEGGACKGICFTIEDGRSCSMYNIASEPDHGRFMLVELIKECCAMGYVTHDCGVTGVYGNYKSLIYLDRVETDYSGIPSFLGSPPSWLIKGRAQRQTVI
jgi:hypothetical protein